MYIIQKQKQNNTHRLGGTKCKTYLQTQTQAHKLTHKLKEHKMTKFNKQKQITRLAKKASKKIHEQYNQLSMSRIALQSYLEQEMWATPNALTYTVGVKNGPNYQIAIIVIPVMK
jgi:hypothetical protein